MPTPIVSRIFSETSRYEANNGYKPKVLYLGIEEGKTLEELMKREGIEWSEGEGAKVARAAYVGIPVYIVDEKTYLACG